MSVEDKDPSPPLEKEGREKIVTRYVGFCDILGFSNQIISDFEGTLKIYKEFGQVLSNLPLKEVEARIYSDAILLIGASLPTISSAIQSLWFVALAHNFMIRGAIAKGRYWEEHRENQLLVASDALVRAVKLEKSIGVPAVFIADDIEIPDEYWLHRFRAGLLQSSILHFRDRNIVNPFNTFWFASAGHRASMLMSTNPSHSEKYLWFLALHKAVSDDAALVPAAVLARFMREGVVELRTDVSSQQ